MGSWRRLHLCSLEPLSTNLTGTHKSEALSATSTSNHGPTILLGLNAPDHALPSVCWINSNKSFTPSLSPIAFHIHCFHSNSDLHICLPRFITKHSYRIPPFIHQSLSSYKCLFLSIIVFMSCLLLNLPKLPITYRLWYRDTWRAWILEPVCLGSSPDSAPDCYFVQVTYCRRASVSSSWNRDNIVHIS